MLSPERRRPVPFPAVGLALLTLAWLAGGCASPFGPGDDDAPIRKALTFHTSFDRNTDADYAHGDAWLYTAPGMNRWTNAQPGLPADGAIRLAPGDGRFGGALRFERKTDAVVFYKADRNVPWSPKKWGGSVSLWLRADLSALAPGFTDPIQITPRAWDDAAFFLEFERRERDVPFRLGAYADTRVWNPQGRKWEAIPAAEKPLLTIPGPPFSGDRWTHVAFVWDHFNTGAPDGRILLYLDGAQAGVLAHRTQTFTWDTALTRILLGVGFVGWIDDVAVFNRPLDGDEVQRVRRLPRGIRSLAP